MELWCEKTKTPKPKKTDLKKNNQLFSCKYGWEYKRNNAATGTRNNVQSTTPGPSCYTRSNFLIS